MENHQHTQTVIHTFIPTMFFGDTLNALKPGLFCHRTRQQGVLANKTNNVMKCLKFQCK